MNLANENCEICGQLNKRWPIENLSSNFLPLKVKDCEFCCFSLEANSSLLLPSKHTTLIKTTFWQEEMALIFFGEQNIAWRNYFLVLDGDCLYNCFTCNFVPPNQCHYAPCWHFSKNLSVLKLILYLVHYFSPFERKKND